MVCPDESLARGYQGLKERERERERASLWFPLKPTPKKMSLKEPQGGPGHLPAGSCSQWRRASGSARSAARRLYSGRRALASLLKPRNRASHKKDTPRIGSPKQRVLTTLNMSTLVLLHEIGLQGLLGC